jgi:hypothetical protein
VRTATLLALQIVGIAGAVGLAVEYDHSVIFTAPLLTVLGSAIAIRAIPRRSFSGVIFGSSGVTLFLISYALIHHVFSFSAIGPPLAVFAYCEIAFLPVGLYVLFNTVSKGTTAAASARWQAASVHSSWA